MMLRRKPHPHQLTLGFGKDAEIERIIEARVAIRAEAAAESASRREKWSRGASNVTSRKCTPPRLHV